MKQPKPEKKYPKEPDWTCIYCDVSVKGGDTHRCGR